MSSSVDYFVNKANPCVYPHSSGDCSNSPSDIPNSQRPEWRWLADTLRRPLNARTLVMSMCTTKWIAGGRKTGKFKGGNPPSMAVQLLWVQEQLDAKGNKVSAPQLDFRAIDLSGTCVYRLVSRRAYALYHKYLRAGTICTLVMPHINVGHVWLPTVRKKVSRPSLTMSVRSIQSLICVHPYLRDMNTGERAIRQLVLFPINPEMWFCEQWKPPRRHCPPVLTQEGRVVPKFQETAVKAVDKDEESEVVESTSTHLESMLVQGFKAEVAELRAMQVRIIFVGLLSFDNKLLL